ncbi:MAG TPA: hypothetical protein VEC35_20950 [Noviherbaspirillum sp.]|nr:hypothetical protein [Noviherbaspirillum sp.]
MNLIDQVHTVEKFDRHVSACLPVPVDAAIRYVSEAPSLAQWYAGGTAQVEYADQQRMVFMVGIDHRVELECIQRSDRCIALRQRIDNSPPIAVTITFSEAADGTHVDIALSGEMSMFWQQKALDDWSSIAALGSGMT